MGRVYKRKTTRAIDKEGLAKAAEQVKDGRISVRGAGMNCGGYEQCRNLNLTIPPFIEKLLANHIKDLENRYHVLTTSEYMELAFEFGKGNDINETGFTIVQAPLTVVGQVGKKQVGAVPSGEKGQLVTVLCAINAGGSAVPPFYVFPRVKVNPTFLNGAFPRAKAATKYDRQVIFIMDNHESHVSLKATTTAKDNGILILTLSPHTSHHLQQIDRIVYGPMKRRLRFPSLNREIFPDDAYLSSDVTDRPLWQPIEPLELLETSVAEKHSQQPNQINS
ncbi:unnamed protein product [Lepeophtheirus salmonis]|uniref:(salmon louse) hypothetical protein n=1 Tax=Lepeophtheirus salmonis TaxID=72036 RepID=A0A7R8HC11_LEPSM|nr:unnamed protein product [Lepeophtheirus salmonis]CAF2993353.1 unnamed protein product [Lepeophtheirus salmonis]